MLDLNVIYNEDCLTGMAKLPSKCADLILCDLPYGTTQNAWDTVIPLDSLWSQYERLIKDNGAIVLTASQPFTSALVQSNLRLFRYSLVWHKTTATGHLNAKKMPLRAHEDILVFYKSPPRYNPQKTTGHKRKVSSAAHKRNCKSTTNYGIHGLSSYDSTERYPRSVLEFKTDKQKSKLHPTQKPVALFEYLIKTFTDVGAVVVDNCIGSGTTAVACLNTNRSFIGFELDKKYYKDCLNRLKMTT